MGKNLTETEWATIAAWVETEGCIDTLGPKYSVRIRIGQKRREPLAWIQERIGGTLKYGSRNWTLRLISKQTTPVLENILPYCIAKRDQVELALELRQLRDWSRSPAKKKRIREIVQALKEAKHADRRTTAL